MAKGSDGAAEGVDRLGLRRVDEIEDCPQQPPNRLNQSSHGYLSFADNVRRRTVFSVVRAAALAFLSRAAATLAFGFPFFSLLFWPMQIVKE